MTRAACVLLLLLVPASATAQVEGALELGYDHDHAWRGLTRVTRPSFQPSAALAWKGRALMVSAGAWSLLEPFTARAGDRTIAGTDATLGEIDYWAQAAYRLRILSITADATAGWTGYTYHGDAAAGGLDDDWNTSELYLGVRLQGLRELYTMVGLPPSLPIGFESNVAVDLGPVGGTHLDAGLIADLPFFFVGEPLGAATVSLVSNWSWNQESGGSDPGYYAGEGFTHATFSAGLTPLFNVKGVPATLHLGGTVQLNNDEATRRRRLDPDSKARWKAWIDATLSLLIPLRRIE